MRARFAKAGRGTGVAGGMAELRSWIFRADRCVSAGLLAAALSLLSPGRSGAQDAGVPAQPGQPVAQPGQPVAQPGQPVAQPGQPVAQPGQPVAQPGQPAAVPADGTAAPWANAPVAATVPAPPSFLDTTDRRIVDERPPPAPEQVAALREMEEEVGRFTKVGGSYRDTVTAIVRREYLRQRRSRDQGYARQIREEERLQTEARARAIRLFEQFIQRYPNDPTYTPDAMFRLGELYFERSSLDFQSQYLEAQAARDRGEDPGPVRDTPDLTPTIELYQRLVRQFPEYRRIDGVYYLIGYCLSEMGQSDAARMAWLNLVCANHFSYDPDAFAAPAADPDEQGEEGDDGEDATDSEQDDAHPALSLDAGDGAVEPVGPYVNPYEQCTPVIADARFLTETWFRIGEYHFEDYADPHGLDLAISAYSRILATPEDRNYNLALYKVAWAYYRGSRYPEAIRHFAMLVQWSDDERLRTGRAGSELRPEAIQYLGITFAYDDWDENQVPDVLEGGPTGLQRVQDPTFMQQDSDWTPEVYFQLGQVYFDEAKYPEAIAVWRLALQRWPNHHLAPEVTNLIARAHTRHNEFEQAIAARAELSRFLQDDWRNENLDHPAELRRAEQLAENSLIGTAVHYHQEAQQLRRRCVADQDPTLCTQAQRSYALAAQAYREYLNRYPNNPQAYELQYNLADALYWSDNYQDSAREYASVRDSNLDDSHLSEAARRVVESLHRVVELQVEAGAMTVREEPPEVQGTPPTVTPIAMPQALQDLAQAREVYLARVDERHDTENLREAYDYNNALLLYFYGYWPQAKDRFERIFTERCSGPLADESGRVAWLNLRNIAVSMQQDAEVERLATELSRRQCTFQQGAAAPSDVDCSDPDNRDEPSCLVMGDLNALRYRRALNVYRDAEGAPEGDQQRQLYEQAATMLVRAVNEHSSDPQAPIALEYAATALERTSRFGAAARLYQRIVDEVGPRRGADAEEQGRLDAILANAYFRLAFNANRFFDYDRAVQNYTVIADSQRFRGSSDATIQERREEALINAGIILENLQQYSRAADYYQRAADTVRDADQRRRSAYRVAEMAYKRHSWGDTVRAMEEFIRRYQSDPGAGELVVQAYWRIAEARQALRQTRDYPRALQAVVDSYRRANQESGSMAAEYAGHAAFMLADENLAAFESYRVNPGRPATLQAYVNALTRQIDEGSTRADTLVKGYDPIRSYGRPTWTIAAYVRQGRVYEVLARGILSAEFVMPADMQAQLRRVPPDQRLDIQDQVTARIQEVLDQRVRPIECFGVARYALAARAARAGAIDNEYTQQAVDRLQAYGEDRIAECIAQAQQNDASFTAYQSGEFARAPRGRNLEPPAGVAAPSLAPPEGGQ